MIYGDDVKKRDRLVSVEDLLLTECLGYGDFYNVHAEDAWKHKDCTPPAALVAMKSFCNLDPHYNNSRTAEDSANLDALADEEDAVESDDEAESDDETLSGIDSSD